MRITISPFPQNEVYASSKLYIANKFSNKRFPQMYTLRLPTSVVIEKGHNANTFNSFRLLMKLKNYLM